MRLDQNSQNGLIPCQARQLHSQNNGAEFHLLHFHLLCCTGLTGAIQISGVPCSCLSVSAIRLGSRNAKLFTSAYWMAVLFSSSATTPCRKFPQKRRKRRSCLSRSSIQWINGFFRHQHTHQLDLSWVQHPLNSNSMKRMKASLCSPHDVCLSIPHIWG